MDIREYSNFKKIKQYQSILNMFAQFAFLIMFTIIFGVLVISEPKKNGPKPPPEPFYEEQKVEKPDEKV